MPAWSALTEHVPAPTRVIVLPFVPPDVQTAEVVVENETGRPDDAVAVTITGDWTIVLFAKLAKVMVWLARGGPIPKFQRLAALLRTVI